MTVASSIQAGRADLVFAGLGALLISSVYLTLLLDASTVYDLIREDGVFETISALVFLIAACLFFAAFIRARRVAPKQSERLRPWLLLAIAGILFVAFGEEISWGQRVFDIATPEALEEANEKGETNIHNLEALQGPLRPNRMFQAFYGSLFVLAPVAAALSPRLRAYLEHLFPVSPPWIAVLIVFNFGMYKLASWALGGYAHYAEGFPVDASAGEINEALLSVLLALAAFLMLRTIPREPTPASERSPKRPELHSS